MIKPLGEDWYLFEATATHVYDPRDGLGANASTSEARGLVRIVGGKGSFISDPEDPNSCRIDFAQLARGAWKLVEKDGSCSGIGSSLTGTYRK